MPRKYTRKNKYLYAKSKNSRNFDDPKYKEWRSETYKRDNYKCQMPGCKYRGKRIEAHHIIRWADAPLLRFDINNGITLCHRCHEKIKGTEYIWAPLFMKLLSDKKNESINNKTNDSKGHKGTKGVVVRGKRRVRRNGRKNSGDG